MSVHLPERVDPVLFASRGVDGEKRFALNKLERLNDRLFGEAGEVTAKFSFFKSGRRPTIVGELKASLPLQCQRCMQTYLFDVDSRFELAVVISEQQAENLPEGVEPLLLEEDVVALAELVEDELLLLLPIVANHPEGECEADSFASASEKDKAAVEEKPNPFAVLSKMKR
jgi:uncharacterized protein